MITKNPTIQAITTLAEMTSVLAMGWSSLVGNVLMGLPPVKECSMRIFINLGP